MIWLFLCGIAAAALAVWTVMSARKAERDYPPRGEFVIVDGTRLHYLRRGAGPPLVLLHGSDGSLLDFADTVLETLSRDYEVFVFDRPGHGYSEGPYHALADPKVQLQLIHEAVCRLGVKRPVLVGHSWSGLLLMMYALEYPEELSGLVLLAPWVYAPSSSPSPLLYAPRVPLLGDLALWTLNRLVKGAVIGSELRRAFLPDPVPAEYARQSLACWLRWPRQVKVFARENTADRKALCEASVRYKEVDVPLVIVAGEADGILPVSDQAQRLHSEIPGSELCLLRGVGHQLMHTRPDEVCDSVARCVRLAQNRGLTALPAPLRSSDLSQSDQTAGSTTTGGGFASGVNSMQRVRDLVFRCGWNSAAYQILNPEMEHWFSSAGDAVVGYVRRGGFRVVAGAPVCEEAKLASAVQEFENEASLAGEKVCYFGAASRLRAVMLELPGHSEIVIGAQPAWNPQGWTELMAKHASLRAQISRARNKGVEVEEWPGEAAARNLSLIACLEEWASSRPLPSLRFMTQPVDLTRLHDRRLFVAQNAGEVVGFLIATPIPDRCGWLIEQIVRGKSAPNGTAELLVGSAMRALAESGAEYVTLGLAPLSKRAGTDRGADASWLSLLLDLIRAHGRRFYNFDGLDSFKAKFRPDFWEPLYAISNERRFSLPALYAIAAAFSEGPPLAAMFKAVLAAARQEIQWLNRHSPSKQA